MPTASKKVLVVTIDGWGTNLLGAYGNAICQTVHLDRLVAQSITFDRCYTNSCDPLAVLESIACGVHPVESAQRRDALQHLSKRIGKILNQAGRQSVFITDDSEVAEQDWVQDFNEVFCFDPQPNDPSTHTNQAELLEKDDRFASDEMDSEDFEEDSDALHNFDPIGEEDGTISLEPESEEGLDTEGAIDEEDGSWEWEEEDDEDAFEPEDTTDHWKETRLAKFTEAALGELARFGETFEAMPDLAWIHLSGLKLTWDAPYLYRLALCDEDDPRPNKSWDPANFVTDSKSDPDQIFDAVCGASAQGKVIDHVWSWIDLFVRQFANPEDLMIVVMGTRGYPLGEHKAVGFGQESLYNEVIHVPLVIKPGVLAIGSRCRRIVQPMSIYATVLDWLIGNNSGRIERAYAPGLLQLLDLTSDTTEIVSIEDKAEMSLSFGTDSIGLQTPNWSAVWEHAPSNEPFSDAKETDIEETAANPLPPPALFLVPDDRWQQNNVAVRVPDIVVEMEQLARDCKNWLIQSESNEPPPISEPLLAPVG